MDSNTVDRSTADAGTPRQPAPTFVLPLMQVTEAMLQRVRARWELTNEKLLKLAFAHTPAQSFFESDEERPW